LCKFLYELFLRDFVLLALSNLFLQFEMRSLGSSSPLTLLCVTFLLGTKTVLSYQTLPLQSGGSIHSPGNSQSCSQGGVSTPPAIPSHAVRGEYPLPRQFPVMQSGGSIHSPGSGNLIMRSVEKRGDQPRFKSLGLYMSISCGAGSGALADDVLASRGVLMQMHTR
jgi:hypothetical protein